MEPAGGFTESAIEAKRKHEVEDLGSGLSVVDGNRVQPGGGVVRRSSGASATSAGKFLKRVGASIPPRIRAVSAGRARAEFRH